MAYPPGTHVRIRSVDHLGKPHKLQHLVGREGIVGDTDRGMNIVTAIGWVVRGYYAFPDDALTVTGRGAAPAMPRRYRVHGYHLPDTPTE